MEAFLCLVECQVAASCAACEGDSKRVGQSGKLNCKQDAKITGLVLCNGAKCDAWHLCSRKLLGSCFKQLVM
jgi:hypothetical protein